MTKEHSGVKANNLMMDATLLYDELPHPVNYTRNWDFGRTVKARRRTSQPVKYTPILDFHFILTPPMDLLKCQ